MLASISICNIRFEIIPLESGIWRLAPNSTNHKTSLVKIAEQLFKQNIGGIKDVIACPEELMIFGEAIDWNQMTNLKLGDKLNLPSLNLPIHLQQTEDLETYLKAKNLTQSAFEKKLSSSLLSIANFGFIPGFIYIDGLDPSLHIPRKTNPIQRCPPRSLAIGGPYLGIYNYPSPAGWHLIGQAAVQIDLEQIKNFSIGQSIKLDLIGIKEYQQLVKSNLKLTEYNA